MNITDTINGTQNIANTTDNAENIPAGAAGDEAFNGMPPVDFLWGSEPFNRLGGDELTCKWLVIKPKTGNLSPAPLSPLSAFCAVPYSGGYPTGYGRINMCSEPIPTTFTDKKIIKGFTHFAPSGTGAIGNYYNYFFIKPSVKKELEILSEKVDFGSYGVTTAEYTCNVQVNGDTACYDFTTRSVVSLMAGRAGLDNDSDSPSFYASKVLDRTSKTLLICTDYKTIKLYWKVTVLTGTLNEVGLLHVAPQDGKVKFVLQVSKTEQFAALPDCDTLADATKKEWADMLNRIEVTTDDEDSRKLFYTALYNSLKKPARFGEEYYDFATLWDAYKTQMPLLFLIAPEKASEFLPSLQNMYYARRGLFHNARLMQDNQTTRFDAQARFLAELVFMTANKYGVPYDYTEVFALATNHLDRMSKRRFPWKHRITHILDFVDCLAAYEHLNPKYSKEAERVTKWVYDREHSRIRRIPYFRYYEGTAMNYSFRVGAGTKYRLAHADKGAIRAKLDDFFGFSSYPVKPFITVTDSASVKAYAKEVNRFEALNNECDMETMYMYNLIDHPHKFGQIIDSVMKYSFHLGADGLGGNDDSGALSSWLVWNMMGLMPVAGTDTLLIGKPHVRSARIGKFRIVVEGAMDGGKVGKITLNGNEIKDYKITVADVQRGGELKIMII